MGAAFDGVGVEELFVGEAAEYQVQLPGEVDGVAEARAHALPDEGRHDVCGVARDEEPARAPLVGTAGLCGVDGVPFQGGVVGVEAEESEEFPDVVDVAEFFDGLAGYAHELPAPVPGSCRDGRARPGRVADLQVVGLVLALVVCDDIADQPVVGEGVVGHGGVDAAADEAVGAVAADHPAGGVRVPAAVGVLGDDVDPVLVLGQVHGGPTAVHGDAGQFRAAFGELRLQARLVHGCRLGPARGALSGYVHVDEGLAAAVLPHVLAGGFADAVQAVGDARGGEDPAASPSYATARGMLYGCGQRSTTVTV